MSEEIKNNSGEEMQDETKNLEEELNDLRDTFQEKYDETVNEADYIAPIQELQDGAEEEPKDDGADGSETDDAADENPAVKKAKTEKVKKPKSKAAKIIIAVVACVAVCLLGVLGTFFGLVISDPDFAKLFSEYSDARVQSSYDAKVEALNTVYGKCTGDSKAQQILKNLISDDVLALTYKNEGFRAAFSAYRNYYGEDAEKVFGSTANKIKRSSALLKSASEKAFPLTIAAAKENPLSVNYDAICKELGIPSELYDTVKECLSPIASGVSTSMMSDTLSAAEFVENVSAAINYYYTAYTNLMSVGADDESLAEKISVALYDDGFIFESFILSSSIFPDDREPINEDFGEILKFKDGLKDYDNKIYGLAVKAIDEGKTTIEDCEALVEGLGEKETNIAGRLIYACTGGIKTLDDNNLAKSADILGKVLALEKMFGLNDTQLAYYSVKCLFDSGEIPNAQAQAEECLSDDNVAQLSEDQREYYGYMTKVFKALASASDIFSPYFSEYYYGGKLDFDALCKELDESITADSNVYDKAFVAYCKYYASVYVNSEDSAKYIFEMQELIPDLPFVYGYFLLDHYLTEGKISDAKAFAEELLTKNATDDYANGVLSIAQRIDGDLEKSLETALKGIELSGKTDVCTKSAAITLMLMGNFDEAYSYVTALYQSALTVNNCELVLVYNALYDGENTEIKEGLATTVAEIENVYSQYGVESLADTKAVIAGEKTLEDIYLSGSYDLK